MVWFVAKFEMLVFHLQDSLKNAHKIFNKVPSQYLALLVNDSRSSLVYDVPWRTKIWIVVLHICVGAPARDARGGSEWTTKYLHAMTYFFCYTYTAITGISND